MKKQTFPPASFADWKAAAEASLKGEPLEKLYTKTAEEIELKPLYTKDDKGPDACLPGEKPFTRGFHLFSSFPRTNPQIGIDPVSAGAAAGVFPDKLIFEGIQHNPVFTINTVPYHMSGANTVQELAIALSETVFYIKLAKAAARNQPGFFVHFAAGPVFFTEIAKMRAFRTLWSALMDVYQLDEKTKPQISVETSERMLSVLDPHVNLLRTGNAAFSAVLGGTDYLTVRPFDEVTGTTTKLSKRAACNIPHLLNYEALLGKVIDPAGGSYYVESLTEEIGRRAWDLFADIEEKGGIEQALKSGMIQQQLFAGQEKQADDAARRKQQLIGVNIYASLSDPLRVEEKKQSEKRLNGEKIIPLNIKRQAEPFEALRLKSFVLQQTGQSVKAGLICLGNAKANKPRTDFAAGVLAAGGIETIWSASCKTIGEAVQFVKENPLPYYCICGTGADYKAFGEPLLQALNNAAGGAVFDAAGRWEAEGLHGNILKGDDLVKKLSALLALYERRTGK